MQITAADRVSERKKKATYNGLRRSFKCTKGGQKTKQCLFSMVSIEQLDGQLKIYTAGVHDHNPNSRQWYSNSIGGRQRQPSKRKYDVRPKRPVNSMQLDSDSEGPSAKRHCTEDSCSCRFLKNKRRCIQSSMDAVRDDNPSHQPLLNEKEKDQVELSDSDKSSEDHIDPKMEISDELQNVPTLLTSLAAVQRRPEPALT